MLNLNIGSAMTYSAFLQILADFLPDLCNYNVHIQIQQNSLSKPVSFVFLLNMPDEESETQHQYDDKIRGIVAQSVAKYILGYQSWQWLIKKTKKQCPDLTKEEWLQIVYSASQWVKGISNGEYDIMNNTLNSRLYQNIYHYISENNSFDVEGYSRFRMADYYAKLEEALTISIEEFYWQREYEELVAVLKSFLANQKEIVKVLHVLMSADGNFTLLDENKQLVRDKNGESATVDGIANLYDDVLLGSILALAPSKIILHHKHKLNGHFKDLLEDVVGERLVYCNGCNICKI